MLRSSLLLAISLGAACAADITVDRSGAANTFDGIGGLSGGGATSRLLVDYVEPQRSQILDYLFKPNYGASLQILKVEIGGDSQSTDGTESSHMHNNQTVDLNTGYEWWLMTEAKKRNPDIKLYGLPWAYPGWVGNDPQTGKPSGSPFTYPEQTSRYITEWIKGAKTQYDLDIDYIGIWNERDSDATYAETLRQTLNDLGFNKTKVVAKDGGADICNSMKKDPKYGASVDIIGLHYPSDFSNYDTCHSLDKPIWASEESSSYDDLNGAACWGRVINSHYAINGMTSSIMWNLVGAYYHGTNWYASSMLTSVQPWSGNYEVNPTIWATAHLTQFTSVGWKYLKVGSGSGKLPNGGYYTALIDPAGDDFTMNIVKISEEHAPCTRPKLPSFDVAGENVTFALADNMKAPAKLAYWFSNYQTDNNGGKATLFEQQTDIDVVDGKFTLFVPVGAHITVSTIRTAVKATPPAIPVSSPSFPLPYSDDFQAKPVSQEAPFLADQIGAFEVHYESKGGVVPTSGNKVMKQMVPQLPIGWSDHGSNGPMTLIGMREWQDISLSVDFKLPPSAPATSAGCVATRVDQMWRNGIIFCIAADGNWNVTVGGPTLGGSVAKGNIVTSGTAAAAPGLDKWTNIAITTVGSTATALLNGKAVATSVAVRDLDTGFGGIGAIGANDWFGIEYDNLKIEQAGNGWHPSSPCGAAKAGDALFARACPTNGLLVDDVTWQLDSNWNLEHVPSGLCATAASASDGAALALATCDPKNLLQKFTNDYTRVRNTVDAFTLQGTSAKLNGNTNGAVTIGAGHSAKCSNPSAYNTTNPKFTGTRCMGLFAITAGDASAAACATASCSAGKQTYQWKDPKSSGGGCWAGSSTNCEPDTSWVGGHLGGAGHDWSTWSFFPNTGQLRNQYTADLGLGFPMCLSTCSA